MTEATMPVTVEQCDRDAAAREFTIPGSDGDRLREHFARAFARHRLNTRATPPSPAGLARQQVQQALYDGLCWFGTLPEPQGDVPERYHRWDDLGELADRILTALTANASQPDRVVDVLRRAILLFPEAHDVLTTQEMRDARGNWRSLIDQQTNALRKMLATLDAKDQSND